MQFLLFGLHVTLMSMARNIGGQPSFRIIFQCPFLHTVSKAFVKSTDVVVNNTIAKVSPAMEKMVIPRQLK